MTRQRHRYHRINWREQLNPRSDYSAIKTTVTNLLDDATTSPHRSVRQLGQWVGNRIPQDWGNYFS